MTARACIGRYVADHRGHSPSTSAARLGLCLSCTWSCLNAPASGHDFAQRRRITFRAHRVLQIRRSTSRCPRRPQADHDRHMRQARANAPDQIAQMRRNPVDLQIENADDADIVSPRDCRSMHATQPHAATSALQSRACRAVAKGSYVASGSSGPRPGMHSTRLAGVAASASTSPLRSSSTCVRRHSRERVLGPLLLIAVEGVERSHRAPVFFRRQRSGLEIVVAVEAVNQIVRRRLDARELHGGHAAAQDVVGRKLQTLDRHFVVVSGQRALVQQTLRPARVASSGSPASAR